MHTHPSTPRSQLLRRTVVAVAGLVGLTGVVMATPAGAATSSGTVISAESSPYGTVLELDSGQFAGYSVYAFSRNTPTACNATTEVNVMGHEFTCAGPENSMTADWPIVSTVGKPVAGPGVNKHLLGMVYRQDIKEDQVTYAGQLLYLFDQKPHQFTGVNFMETVAPLPPWHGVWSLVSPKDGHFVTGPMTITTQTQPNGATVLAMTMFQGMGPGGIVVYEYSKDSKGHSACTGTCALNWPPALTSSTVSAGPGLSKSFLGTITRSNGTHQITYKGHPLYLYSEEMPLLNATTGAPDNPATTGSGNGLKVANGTFSLVSVG
jgi:predicted lipoprotein with Yx(FWY)xxD motif